MAYKTKAQLEAAWAAGNIRAVGYEVDGEANVQDLLDSMLRGSEGQVTVDIAQVSFNVAAGTTALYPNLNIPTDITVNVAGTLLVLV